MSLYEELDKCLVTYHLEDSAHTSEFLPLSDINTKITETNIRSQLSLFNRLWHPTLPRTVLLQARKIFALLVLIHGAWAIENLIRQDNISDADLPLTRKGSIGKDDYNVLVSLKTGKVFPSFATWPKKMSVRDFLNMQWVVQAPVLDCFGKHILLDHRCPLPLTESFTKAKRGGSALVHKCKVHGAHQTIFKVNTEPYIAIKEVNVEQSFDKERENLKLIQDLEHKHLIKLIATCQKGPIFYFMFPWAYGGDLRDFWKRNDLRPRTPALILWSLRQMLGIVSAIKALHGKNIRHGDIKPQNILHFLEGEEEENDQEGILVVADVGVSNFHRGITSMRNAPTTYNEATASYEAPEAQLDQREGRTRSRRYDMWSLGCMFLEFTVWLVYNHNAVRSFRWSRVSRDEATTTPGNFFTRKSESSVQIHPAVNEALKDLRSNPLCKDNTALGDLIQIIEERLLHPDVLRRADASEFFDKLRMIICAAEENPGYVDGQNDTYLTDLETDIETEIENVFTEAESLAGTASSAGTTVIRGEDIREVSNALLGDPMLRSLYVDAVSRVDRRKCRAHFKGFLQNFAARLKDEAGEYLETKVAGFIGLRAGQVSDEIRRAIVSPNRVAKLEEGSSRLEHQLAAIKGQNDIQRDKYSVTEGQPREHEGTKDEEKAKVVLLEPVTGQATGFPPENQLQTDDYPEISDPGEGEPLVLIDDLKGFILKSDAFKALIKDMKSWLKRVEKEPAAEADPSVPATADTQVDISTTIIQTTVPQSSSEQVVEDAVTIGDLGLSGDPAPQENFLDIPKSRMDSWDVLGIFRAITTIFIPPVKQGHRRLSWRCSCGTSLWGDFDNSDPKALDELLEEMNRAKTEGQQQGGNSGASGTRYQESTSITSSLGTTALQQNSRSSPLYDLEQQAPSANVGNPTSDASRVAQSSSVRKRQFFEVCIGTGDYTVRLKEINLAKVWSDGELFAQIWDRYSDTWGRSIWKILLKPRDVHFVMFSIDQSSYDLAGIHKRPDEYPPEEEVDNQRYHYLCPKILMPAHLFLHFLHRARRGSKNEHMKDTWLQRLPKKLDTSILDIIRRPTLSPYPRVRPAREEEENDLIFGWGAHIIEGPNHVGLSLLVGCFIIFAFVLSFLLVVFEKTEDLAFGVGQFLIAILACGMTVTYFFLTDR